MLCTCVPACFILSQEKNYILLDIPFQACNCKTDTGFEFHVKKMLGWRTSPFLSQVLFVNWSGWLERSLSKQDTVQHPSFLLCRSFLESKEHDLPVLCSVLTLLQIRRASMGVEGTWMETYKGIRVSVSLEPRQVLSLEICLTQVVLPNVSSFLQIDSQCPLMLFLPWTQSRGNRFLLGYM